MEALLILCCTQLMVASSTVSLIAFRRGVGCASSVPRSRSAEMPSEFAVSLFKQPCRRCPKPLALVASETVGSETTELGQNPEHEYMTPHMCYQERLILYLQCCYPAFVLVSASWLPGWCCLFQTDRFSALFYGFWTLFCLLLRLAKVELHPLALPATFFVSHQKKKSLCSQILLATLIALISE